MTTRETPGAPAAREAAQQSAVSTPAPLTALITGGTRRVGLAIARAFAERPGSTVIVTTRDPSSGEASQARRTLEATGCKVWLERFDPNSDEADDLARRVAQRVPALDALVLNASSYGTSELDQLSPESLRMHMQVNAFGPVLLVAALRKLLEQSRQPGGAGVVAMADMHVLGRPRKNLLAYSMSKAALVEAVRTLARELAPRIRVNAIAPGVVEWPDTGSESQSEFQRAYLSRVPLERAGTPEDAAAAVRWLALEARYTTGEIVRVDGGRWLA